MAATLQYGRERAHLGRSLLNFMRITRDAHAPELTLGEIGDSLFTAIEVFVGHAFERPMVLSELSRNHPDRLSRVYRPPLLHDGESERAASARSALGAPSQYAVRHKRSVQNGHRWPSTGLIHAIPPRALALVTSVSQRARAKAIRLSSWLRLLCARAASGHDAAAPPSNVTKSRRLLIRSPRR